MSPRAAIALVWVLGLCASLSSAEPKEAKQSSGLPMLPNFFTSSIREQSTWLPEIAFGVFVLMFVVNIFKGRDSNTKKAVYWATQVGGLVTSGGLG